jgi:uridine phosphorylase
MKQIPSSELIINERGAVYHLDLRPEELANTVITVGDPDRVQEVSKHFDQVEVKRQHREFITHTGRIGTKRITVLSSGIGPDNIDIVMNELDALANIDLSTRLGTSGSLQAEIPVDSLVASTHGLGIDNLLHFYRLEQNEEESQLIQSFVAHTQISGLTGLPYISSAAPSLLKHFAGNFHQGITVTCPGFYGPQGRVLRLGLRNPDYVISNFEMETSAIYGLGSLLGHHCLALNAIVANRVRKEFSAEPAKTIERLIQSFLTTFADSIE